MDKFIVSARKYRPATFDTVIGQNGLTTTLKNAILEDKLAHAYLFCGPRGVGKTTCARIFAKTINCSNLTPEGEACNECESCRAFNEGRSLNIHELDAASNNSVDDIRNLIDQVRIPPQVGRYKVFIIDEVHMLSTQAFNAFLKTLEEPPTYAKFILATTERHKVLPTILSRCQVYDFYRISLNDIVEHLRNVAAKEQVVCEDEALTIIAQKADGGMRDALSLFDQMVSYTQGKLTYKDVIDSLNILDYEYFFRFTDLFLEHNVPQCLMLFNEILQRGFDGGNFIGGLAAHLRDLLVSRDAVTLPLLDVGQEMRIRYQQQAQRCTQKFLYRSIRLCNDCDLNYKASRNKRLLVELTLIQLAQLSPEVEGDDSDCAGRRPAHLNPIFGTTPTSQTDQPKKSTPIIAAVENSTPAAPASTIQSNIPTPTSLAASHATSARTADAIISSTTPATSSPIGRRKSTISIHSQKEQQESPLLGHTVAATSEAVIPSNYDNTVSSTSTPLTEESLLIAWKEYAKQLPQDDNALAGRMFAIRPKLASDGITISITVSNQFVEKDFNEIRPHLLNFLKGKFNNRNLSMNILLQEAPESTRFLSPHEQYERMKEKNSSLSMLSEVFDLDLV